MKRYFFKSFLKNSKAITYFEEDIYEELAIDQKENILIFSEKLKEYINLIISFNDCNILKSSQYFANTNTPPILSFSDVKLIIDVLLFKLF